MADEQPHPPRIQLSHRQLFASLLFVAGVIAFLYLVLPKIVGFETALKRLRQGNVWWLVGAGALEVMAYVSYATLFRAVYVKRTTRVTLGVSYQIGLASEAATRVLAAGGAGGIALTAWALRRAGLDSRTVAARMIAFLVLLYGVYMGTLVIDGVGLYLQLWPGQAPLAITIVPAIFGAVVIVLFLAIAAIPGDFERFVARWSAGAGPVGTLARRLATVPASAATGVRAALALLRTGDPGLLGALGNWGFDIGCLWACFHAFGYAPPTAVVIMAYFVGWIANLLPLPGGLGGVEGGLIGAFSAFGIDVSGAVVAVLAYRAISFWLPTPAGIIAYLQLRRTVRRWDGANLSEV